MQYCINQIYQNIRWFMVFFERPFLRHPCFCLRSVKRKSAYFCLEGVDDQRHAHKELRGELGQILSEPADAGVHLLHAAGVDEVATGALIDVPGGQQTQGALSW